MSKKNNQNSDNNNNDSNNNTISKIKSQLATLNQQLLSTKSTTAATTTTTTTGQKNAKTPATDTQDDINGQSTKTIITIIGQLQQYCNELQQQQQQIQLDKQSIVVEKKEIETNQKLYQKQKALDEKGLEITRREIELEKKTLQFQKQQQQHQQASSSSLSIEVQQQSTQIEQIQQQINEPILSDITELKNQHQLFVAQFEGIDITALKYIAKQHLVRTTLMKNRSQKLDNKQLHINMKNYSDLFMACASWRNITLADAFYNYLVQRYFRTVLHSLEQTIRQKKIYVSSISVLNGEWIQIQGEGALINMNDYMLYDFFSNGHQTANFTSCTKHCNNCHNSQYSVSEPKSLRFTINFKWE